MDYATEEQFRTLMHLIFEDHAWRVFYCDVMEYNPKDILIKTVRLSTNVMYILTDSSEEPRFGLRIDDRYGVLVKISPEHPLWLETPIRLTDDQREQYISMLDDVMKMREM